MKILLVDNNKVILDTMAEILEICHNHEVQGVASGKEALRFLRKTACDLIVMDLALPVMNGLETIGRIRKRYPKIPIAVLTGIKCNDSIMQKLQELEVHNIFIKPRGIHDLLKYIQQLQAKISAA